MLNFKSFITICHSTCLSTLLLVVLEYSMQSRLLLTFVLLEYKGLLLVVLQFNSIEGSIRTWESAGRGGPSFRAHSSPVR
jgi:hypothetical protein